MLKKRLIVFAAGLILVGLLITVTVFIRTPHVFVLDITPSGSLPGSPSPSQPMGTTGEPWPSNSGTPSPTMSFSMPPSPSESPTPSMSMSPTPTPDGGPYDIVYDGDLDVEVSGSDGVIHIKWHTTTPMTGIKNLYLGPKILYPLVTLPIDLSKGQDEIDLYSVINIYEMRLQSGYCRVDFWQNKYSVEVDFPISPSCYEITPPPQDKSGIFGYVYDANDPDHPRINAASVTLEAAGGYPVYPGTILTNPEGEYQYTNVLPGSFYKLVVMKEGYETKVTDNFTLQAGVEKNLNVGLYPQAPPKDKFTLAADVHDTQGSASDVNVRLESDQLPGYAWSTKSSGANIDPTKYGDSTNLVIKNIPIDKVGVDLYHFTGTADGPYHKETTFDFYVDKDDLIFDYNANAYVVRKDLPIIAKLRLDVKCKVINGLTGEPIEGAKVIVRNVPLDWEVSGNTGSGGVVWFYNYPIDDGPGGAAMIHSEASYPHFKIDEGETSFHDSDAGSTHLFTFSLIPIQGQYVYGRVIDKDTKTAINGARVQIIKNDQFTGNEAITNEYGRYYITNPGSGDMIVRALRLDYYDDIASRKEVTLAAGEDKEVNFRLRHLLSVNNTFDLTIDHVYKLENGNQVLIGDQDAVEIRLSSGFNQYAKRIIYGESVAEKGPKQPFHIFSGLPIYPTAIKATIFNPSDNDPGWVPKYRTVAELLPTTSDPMTIDLVLEPILQPPLYSGGAIIRGTTSLFRDPCQALADEIREFLHSFTSRVPAPKGIPVYLYHPYDHTNPIQTTTTDIAGEFEFINVPVGTYDIKVESRNYLGWQEAAQAPGGSSIGNYSIVLAGKSSGMTKTRNYHNVEVKFIGFGSHSYIGKFDWNNEINEVMKIHNQTSLANPIPTIYVVESDLPVAALLTDICGERIVVTTRMLQAIIDNNQKLRYLIAHEYAHKYYRIAGFWVPWVGHFGTIFNAAKDTSPCSFSRITDSNITLDQLYIGHPEDGKNEYFASFFNAYFLHHDRLFDIIRNDTSGECKYTLAYTWQWFAENVGKVYTNDDAVFHPLNGGLNGIDYTKAQIKNGDWIDPPFR